MERIELSPGLPLPLDGGEHMSPDALEKAVGFMANRSYEEIREFPKQQAEELLPE